MKFRTEIEIKASEQKIDYSSKLLSLGSCFAQSIGDKLVAAKFMACVNPVGVLFNPLSICATLDRFSQCRLVELAELEEQGRGGEWFHFDFHGSLSGLTPEVTLKNLNDAVLSGHQSLEICDTIIITLGTVWVYELADSGAVVANCHKQPAQRFVRRAMSTAEVVECLAGVVERFPAKQFIFSVSPVRHLSDGLAENSLSKATLRVAVSQVVEHYANASYFEAYEIMMDDLRDYRFYADDLLHPSTKAVEYIWERFCEQRFSRAAFDTMSRVNAIVRAAAHRPLSEGSQAHRRFCEQQLEAIKELEEIDFGKENAYFRSQLQKKL